VTGQRRRPRPLFIFIEKSVPDRRRVENGLRILGRLVAEAYARERALGQSNGGASSIEPGDNASTGRDCHGEKGAGGRDKDITQADLSTERKCGNSPVTPPPNGSP